MKIQIPAHKSLHYKKKIGIMPGVSILQGLEDGPDFAPSILVNVEFPKGLGLENYEDVEYKISFLPMRRCDVVTKFKCREKERRR